MAAIALALLLAPEVFWQPLDGKARRNLYRWLSFIETEELPPMNWHFFRLIVQAAFRELGLPVNAQAEETSFNIVESCYRDDGWYQDGEGGSFDLYNPMGFHYYSLVLAALEERKSASGRETPAPPIRRFAERFRDRAKTFGASFAAWFYRDGSAIPYGRSLTYRFAESAFFSACAFAGLEVLPWGVMKGIVLRNLRRWYSRPILDKGGCLTVGYGYPNQTMADTYNAPGSPYWAFKIYLVLALGEDHPFWQAEEASQPAEPRILSEKAPCFVLSRGEEDVQLLTAGRYPNFDMAHAADKYCKFAYSARFGFCVSHSSYNIAMTGCDSMLMLSEGDDYWRQRRQVWGQTVGPNWTASFWAPWPDVVIHTTLVSQGAWHVRIHRIESARTLKAVEGGFALRRCRKVGETAGLSDSSFPGEPELKNSAAGSGESLLVMPWGASRIAALEPDSSRTGSFVIPAPNLNILESQVAVPVLEGTLAPGTTVWASAVRAGDSDPVRGEKIPHVVLGESECACGAGRSE
jgi:hypothetical protein